MDDALRFENVIADGVPAGLSFALPAGSLGVIVTSRHDENAHLVRLMLGMSNPASGSVSLLGSDVGMLTDESLNSLRQHLAVVYSTGGLVSNLKVWENLLLPLEYSSLCSPVEIEERGLAVLNRVGYSGRLMETPGRLSLYEKRLVGLARALLIDPRLIVCDAILAGLSREEQQRIVSTVLEFHHEEPERTTLLITSDPDSVKDIPFDCRIVLQGSASND